MTAIIQRSESVGSRWPVTYTGAGGATENQIVYRNRLLRLGAGMTTQFARPDADHSNPGNWGLTPLWDKIDEVVVDDATTEITTADSTNQTRTFRVRLSDVVDPQSSSGHIVRIRVRHIDVLAGSANVSFNASVYQGTTLIGQAIPDTNVGNAYETLTGTLPTAQADAITDYTDLFLEVSAFRTNLLGTWRGVMTWAEFEVPPVNVSGRQLVIYCHGANSDSRNGFTYLKLRDYAKNGSVVISPDFGGVGTVGNDTGVAGMVGAVAHARANLGASNDPVLMIGASGGMASALQYARQNPGAVAAVACVIGAADLEDIRANNRGGLAATIEAAYGGNTAWQTARPNYNPVEFGGQLDGLPVRLWYSTDDTLVLPSTQTAFAALATSFSAVDYGAQGHSFNGLPYDDIMTWLLDQV